MLLENNIGENLSLDETMLCRDLITFLSNKDGHGKKGFIIAAVCGTKSEDVTHIIKKTPLEQREKVREVTLDFSESMRAIATSAFPNAMITVDCFHIVKRCIDAIEELRLKFKREAVKKQKQ